jgi:lysophospholipase L1-like esterase
MDQPPIGFFGDSLTSGLPGSSYLAILREKLPDHPLVNLGRGNDTVVSLSRRIAGLRFDQPFALAFLWIGVNDASRRPSWPHRAFHALLRQRRARDLDEFRACYRSCLDLLCRNAGRVIAVAPLIRGEDLGNGWNRQLKMMSSAIEELAGQCARAEFLDLRPVFAAKLAAQRVCDYVPRSAIRVALDALTLRSDEQIDRKARQRGLYLTLDGLHLNSAGAQIVADAFAEIILRSEATTALSPPGMWPAGPSSS